MPNPTSSASARVPAPEAPSRKELLARIETLEAPAQELEAERDRLCQSEAKYRTLFDSMDEGLLLAEVIFEDDRPVDLLYLEANPAAIRMTGQEYAGRRLREIDPGFEPYWVEIWGRVARTGQGERLQRYAEPLKSGFDFYLFRVGDAESRRVAVVFRDISEQRRTEQALQESRERFRSVLETSLDAAYRRDLRTDSYDYLSPVIEQVLGISPERMQTMPVDALLERIHPADRDGVRQAIAEGIRSRQGLVEYRFSSEDGAYRWVADHFTVQTDDAGRPVFRTGIVRDVTEQKRAEATLRESEERFRLMADGAPVLIWVADVENRGTWFNKPWLDFTGRSLDQEIGFGWVESLHREDREPCATYCNAAFARREPFTMEFRLRRHDGQYRWMLDNGVPLYGPGGEFRGYIGSCIDVTEHKEAEAALREATRVAEQASQAKSQFLAVMSHELRTPLTGVIGFADLLETEVLGPATAKQREALSRIQASAWHLVSIIDEILTLSRAEAGKEEVRWEEADVAEITREVVRIIDPQASARGLQLDVLDVADPVVVQTDPGKVRQILINLMGNAVKYTREGRITVQVDRCSASESLQVHVCDTGPGIASEDQERIFEPFTQVDSLHTRPGSGTGLGLTISRKLARLLGGEVTLRSTPGEGSTFTLHLPRNGLGAS